MYKVLCELVDFISRERTINKYGSKLTTQDKEFLVTLTKTPLE